jgi:assimilatory nitrate reductase catalytic subunit
LSAFENDGARAFDIGAYADIDEAGYARLAPFQWPQRRGEVVGDKRLFANGGFFTLDGRARMVATPYAPPQTEHGRFVLNTGRIRDQWHTMTRSGKAARLMAHYGEPFCEIHPDDAERIGIKPAALVELSNERGRVVLRALITSRQRVGSAFAPMHWNDAFASNARIDALVAPACDPLSGQPASKQSFCDVRAWAAGWHGFAISAARPDPQGVDYWALAPADGGWRIELAGKAPQADWQAFAARLFGGEAGLEWLAYRDEGKGVARLAAFEGERLVGALFVARDPVAVARAALVGALQGEHVASRRQALLAGRAGAEQPDPGALVCACFNVGVNQIRAAILDGSAASVDAIGVALKAGTNCGSCRSEIGRLIAEAQPAAA